MILYFDSYITDVPLIKEFVSANDTLRKSCENYSMPRKVDIAKYSLASYATYNWSHVLIRYELEDQNEYASFDKYILNLFPNAIILHERSDSQADFRKSIKIMENFDDEWIFYSANNDHPMITANPKILDELIGLANRFRDKYEFISIINSHFSLFFNLPIKGTPVNAKFGQDADIIEENNLASVIVRHNGENSSVQIVNKKLFHHWYSSKELGDLRIIRPESVRDYIETPDQLVIIPKVKICDHFDGYSHTMGQRIEIRPEFAPPLFIPKGFFQNNVRIAYGYDIHREGWVNINPSAKKYSFVDPKYGTDLKCSLDEIPFFWKGHIKELDINKDANLEYLKNMSEKVFHSEKYIFKASLAKKIQGLARKYSYFLKLRVRAVVPEKVYTVAKKIRD